MIWHSAFRLVPYITSYSSRCRGISVKYFEKILKQRKNHCRSAFRSPVHSYSSLIFWHAILGQRCDRVVFTWGSQEFMSAAFLRRHYVQSMSVDSKRRPQMHWSTESITAVIFFCFNIFLMPVLKLGYVQCLNFQSNHSGPPFSQSMGTSAYNPESSVK